MRTAEMIESLEGELLFHSRTPIGFGEWLHEPVPEYGYFTTIEPPRYFNAAIFYDGVEDEEAVLVTDQELDLHYISYAKRMNFAHSLDLLAIHHESRRKIDLVKAVRKLQQAWKSKLTLRGFYLLPKQGTPTKPRESGILSKKASRPVFASNFSETLAAGENTPHSMVDMTKKSFSPIPKDIEIIGSVKHGSPRDRSVADHSIHDIEEPEFKVSPRLRDATTNVHQTQVSKSQYSFALRSLDHQVISASIEVGKMQPNALSNPDTARERSVADPSDQQTIKRSASMLSMKSDSNSAFSAAGLQKPAGSGKSNAIRFKSNLSKSQKEFSPMVPQKDPVETRDVDAEPLQTPNSQLEELRSKLDTSIREEGLLGEGCDQTCQNTSPLFNLLDNHTATDSPMKSVEVLKELSRAADSTLLSQGDKASSHQARLEDSFTEEEPLGSAPNPQLLEKSPDSRTTSQQAAASASQPQNQTTVTTAPEQDFQTADSARSDCGQIKSNLKSKAHITSSFKKKPRPAVSSTLRGHIEVVFEEQEARKSQEPRSIPGKSQAKVESRPNHSTNPQGLPLVNPRGSVGHSSHSIEGGLSSYGQPSSNRKYLPNIRPETQLSPKTASGSKTLEARRAVLRDKSPNSANRTEIRSSDQSLLNKSTEKKSLISSSKKVNQTTSTKSPPNQRQSVDSGQAGTNQAGPNAAGRLGSSSEKVGGKTLKRSARPEERPEHNSPQKENIHLGKPSKAEVVSTKNKTGVSQTGLSSKSGSASHASTRSRLSSELQSDTEAGAGNCTQPLHAVGLGSYSNRDGNEEAATSAQRPRCYRCGCSDSSSFFRTQSIQTDPINLESSTNLNSPETASLVKEEAEKHIGGQMAEPVDPRCLWMAQQIQVGMNNFQRILEDKEPAGEGEQPGRHSQRQAVGALWTLLEKLVGSPPF